MRRREDISIAEVVLEFGVRGDPERGLYLLRTRLIALEGFGRTLSRFSGAKAFAERSRPAGNVSPIRTELMERYVREMQLCLREKKIGCKKEFLREILKELRSAIQQSSVNFKAALYSKNCSIPSSGKEEFLTCMNGGADGGRTHDL